jgi:hypothetical protein
MVMTTSLIYHVGSGRLTGTVGGKPLTSLAQFSIDSPGGVRAGKYRISAPRTSPALGLHALVSAIHLHTGTIDFLTSPARNALAEVTIDFLRAPAGNAPADVTIDFLRAPARNAPADVRIDFLRAAAGNVLAGGSTATFVMRGSTELMQALAGSAGGLLQIIP